MTGAILQNLIDAGCDENTISGFASCKSIKDEIRVLEKHRSALLDRSHEVSRQLSCLDYLIYNLKKSQSSTNSKFK